MEQQQQSASTELDRPRLIVFYSERSGRCRRVDGYLAQALQHRHNHETFTIVRVSVDERPDLADRFGVEEVPTFFVVEGRAVRAKFVAPHGAGEIRDALSQWLN